MKIVVFFAWDFLGSTSHGERDFDRLVWVLLVKKWKKVQGVASLCIFWTLWKERNEISILNGMFFGYLLFWVKLYFYDGSVSPMDFV